MQISENTKKTMHHQRRNCLTDDQIRHSFEIYHSSISCFLPKDIENMLDIGCGSGLTSVRMFKHYFDKNNKSINLYLMDKDRIDRKIYFGFKPDSSAYCELQETKKNLILNNIDEKYFHIYDILKYQNKSDFFDQLPIFDLVISCISWGFHYPISVYLDCVTSKLKNGGILILDSSDPNDIELLSKDYVIIHSIPGPNQKRLVCKKM